MIKNVFLDLDGTIFDFHASEKVAVRETMEKFGIAPTDDNIAAYKQINISQWKLLELGKITREALRVRRFELFFEAINVNAPADAAATYYENSLMTKCNYIPHGKELLCELYGKYRLYLATNGYEKTQRGRIETSGIGRYFDGIFISQAIGYDKPSREFFSHCFDQIPDFKKEETVMIGDSLSSDILGASNAGIASIWFNPGGDEPVGARPDFIVAKLCDILPLLEKM